MEAPLHEGLTGQVALVTGASRGIGHRIAAELARHGAKVYAGTRDAGDEDPPEGTRALHLDVTREETVQAAALVIEEEAGRLDILVNNAGIAPGAGITLLEEPLEQFDEVLRVNLRGAVVTTKATLPLLFRRRGARVVNMSSGMGNLAEGMDGGAPAYRISKTAINGLTAYLHGEFHASHGLISNAVCPGWVRTEMGGAGADRSVEKGAETPVWLCRFREDAPSGLWWRDKHVIPW